MKTKATTVTVKPDFEPIKLEITFESEKELNSFYSVMNYSPICDWLRNKGVNPSDMRYALREACGSYPAGEVSELIKYLKERA